MLLLLLLQRRLRLPLLRRLLLLYMLNDAVVLLLPALQLLTQGFADVQAVLNLLLLLPLCSCCCSDVKQCEGVQVCSVLRILRSEEP